MEKLFLWGEAVKLQIPDNLLAYEASTRGFVGQPLGGKDKILISQHTNRLKHHNPLFPYFKLHDPAPNSAPRFYLHIGCHSELHFCMQTKQVGSWVDSFPWFLHVMLFAFLVHAGRHYSCSVCHVSPLFLLSFPFLPLSRRRRVPSTIAFLMNLWVCIILHGGYICCPFSLETPSTSAGKYAMSLFVKPKRVLQQLAL